MFIYLNLENIKINPKIIYIDILISLFFAGDINQAPISVSNG